MDGLKMKVWFYTLQLVRVILGSSQFWGRSYHFPLQAAATAFNKRMNIAAYWFLVHSSVANLCILRWNRSHSNRPSPYKHNFHHCETCWKNHFVSIADSLDIAIPLSWNVRLKLTYSFKKLRLTDVSGFDILSSALLFYAVVRILAVVRKQSLQNSAMYSLRKEL